MILNKLSTTALSALVAGAMSSAAQAEDLTLCWAAWDPANALIELSKDYEAQSGNKMHFEFVPWPNFADRMLNELNSGGKLCDLLIGDSQWIGGAAENDQYVKLNDFFAANDISMDDFIPATVTGYAEWPKNTPNYYALPAFGDVVGWTYRKDWFERPEIQAEFQEKYGRKLGVPATLEELKDIAQFFQGRDIDGATVYGAAIYTERGSEGITMGVTNALIELDGPEVPIMDGSSRGFVQAIQARGLRHVDGEARAIRILKPVEVVDQGRVARLEPSDGFEIDFEIVFEDAAIGAQSARLDMGPGVFADQLMECRTFCRKAEVDALQKMGLARGGSLENAIVVDGGEVLNPGGLRRPDEFVRHKMLDAVGDLALAGAPIIGRYVGRKAGHEMTNKLLRALFAAPDAWRFEVVEHEAPARRAAAR